MLGGFLLICVGDKIVFLCVRVLWQVFRIRKQFVNYALVEGNERMVFAFGIWESPVGHSCTGRSCSLSWQVGFKAFLSGCARSFSSSRSSKSRNENCQESEPGEKLCEILWVDSFLLWAQIVYVFPHSRIRWSLPWSSGPKVGWF